MSPDALAEALARLPHGPEFRFLDRLLSLTPGKEGVGEYRVRGDELFLRGHFPGNPMMPGVLLVEAAAQLAGVVAQSDPTVLPLPELKLAALRVAKILGTARPGETLYIEARIAGRLKNLVHAETSVSAGGTLLLSADVTLAGLDQAFLNPRVTTERGGINRE